MAITNITISNLSNLATRIPGTNVGADMQQAKMALLIAVVSKVLIEHLNQGSEDWISVESSPYEFSNTIYNTKFRRSDSDLSFILSANANGIDASIENNSVIVPMDSASNNCGRIYKYVSGIGLPSTINLRILHSIEDDTIALGVGVAPYEGYGLVYGKNMDNTYIAIGTGITAIANDSHESVVLSSHSTVCYPTRAAEIISGSIDKFINLPDGYSETNAKSIYTALNIDTTFMKENLVRNGDKFISFNINSEHIPNVYKSTLAIPVDTFIVSHKAVDATDYIQID